jgi:hypothetical protein
MRRSDPLWREHLDIITAWGEASAISQTPPPSDNDLWAATRMRQDLHVPDQTDTELVAQLREAFNRGRYPRRIDLQAVADALRERGHHAFVEHEGGGAAVLYAGRHMANVQGNARWSAAAGPGRYTAPGGREPFADPHDLTVGPHGDDDVWAVVVPPTITAVQLVDLIAAVVDYIEAQRARFARAAQTARGAMWSTFAAQYPEISTGNLVPGADEEFIAVSTALMAEWLDMNGPSPHLVPAHIAAIAIAGRTTGSEDRDR